eukprot:3113238-Karenia_brevis.AAC.1
MGRDKSQKQARGEWATKVLGRVLSKYHWAEVDTFRSEGIVEFQSTPVAKVDVDDPSKPPLIVSKGQTAEKSGIDIAWVNAEMAKRTAKRSRGSGGERWESFV